jgi:hypothetical protein
MKLSMKIFHETFQEISWNFMKTFITSWNDFRQGYYTVMYLMDESEGMLG